MRGREHISNRINELSYLKQIKKSNKKEFGKKIVVNKVGNKGNDDEPYFTPDEDSNDESDM